MDGPWRVAFTRDETGNGRLSEALRAAGLIPGACATAHEAPPADRQPLDSVARTLEEFDWAVFASARAVRALMNARGSGWPQHLKSAAAGRSTAAALTAAGANPAPLVAEEAGADALWALLRHRDTWPGKRVLFPVVADGRRTLIDGLAGAGANVTIVEAYRMLPRTAAHIAANWRDVAPHAVIVTSPSAARILTGALGLEAFAALRAIIAIGHTTARELTDLGLQSYVSPSPEFDTLARFTRQCLTPA